MVNEAVVALLYNVLLLISTKPPPKLLFTCHWYPNPWPVAETENVVLEPAHVDADEGCAVIVVGVVTVIDSEGALVFEQPVTGVVTTLL